MKYNQILPIVFGIICLSLFSCKKDTDVNIDTFKIEKEVEKITVGTNTASISGTYAYSGKINSLKVRVGKSEQLFGSDVYIAEVSGKAYSVNITGLQSGTLYHYRYEVDYGASEDFLTEIDDFTTLSESPTVKTLEVLALDSTTFRVKCEVVADGGSDVTERGICWNTYGDPTLDDETMQHASGGVGQYTIRMEHLALGKTYYVRAYAKNEAGEIGLGEEVLDFETDAPAGLPVDIVLSCDPEEGGAVIGGGSYEVGTQCTVTAVANAGYTFINWTENGNQVSSEATYTFNVTRECSLVANFTTQAYIITAEVTPENSGTVTGAGGYNYGEECTLTATAKPGYEFVKWTKNGTNVSTDVTFTFTVIASATYVAHFQSKSYTVSISAQPTNGGSTTGGGTYNYGQFCTVHATSAEGYTFVNWTDDGDEVSTNANYTFTVMGNRTLVASFTLQAVLPTVTTIDVTDITQTTATGGGNISSDGGTTVTECGICWSTSHNPTTSSSHASNGTGTGTFTLNMTGLSPGTTYYVRAYAINSVGTAYGSEVTFTTLSAYPIGAINGLFSVSETQQVYFSKGNLQYIGSASTPYWKFAENQWVILGTTSGQNSTSQTVDRDFFGWGTSGYSHGAVCYQPWSTSRNKSDYYVYGQVSYNLYDQDGRADWGYNAISNGGGQENSGWRMLTGGNNGEWNYIFNQRNASTVNGTPNARFVKAKVNNVHGVILFPDIYTHPSGVTQPIGINDTEATGWNGNDYSATEFELMEQNGAVFLPAAGSRDGTSVSNVGSGGYYWSASYNSSNAYSMGFYDTFLGAQTSVGRYGGRSVRLVRSAQ